MVTLLLNVDSKGMKVMKIKRLFFISIFLISGLAQGASLSDTQKKELTLFGMKAMGLNVEIGHVKKILSGSEVNEMVATGLNLNGYLCAEVIAVRPLKVKKFYEATCIAYRGGSSKKFYIIDALKGIAFVP